MRHRWAEHFFLEGFAADSEDYPSPEVVMRDTDSHVLEVLLRNGFPSIEAPRCDRANDPSPRPRRSIGGRMVIVNMAHVRLPAYQRHGEGTFSVAHPSPSPP